MVQQVISEMLNIEQGQLVNKSRVVDNLLDIRLAASANGDIFFVSEIDKILNQVPGVTVVASAWWIETLTDLQELAVSAVAV